MDRSETALLVTGILLALGAGGVMALQPAVNGRFAGQCNHPIQASIISFGTGFLALLAVGWALRVGWPSAASLRQLPWWAWTGGLLGTYMVTVTLLIAPKLGATRWIALVLSGQIVLSLALDHFGLLGYSHQPLNWTRILGVAMLAVGVILVMNR